MNLRLSNNSKFEKNANLFFGGDNAFFNENHNDSK